VIIEAGHGSYTGVKEGARANLVEAVFVVRPRPSEAPLLARRKMHSRSARARGRYHTESCESPKLDPDQVGGQLGKGRGAWPTLARANEPVGCGRRRRCRARMSSAARILSAVFEAPAIRWDCAGRWFTPPGARPGPPPKSPAGGQHQGPRPRDQEVLRVVVRTQPRDAETSRRSQRSDTWIWVFVQSS